MRILKSFPQHSHLTRHPIFYLAILSGFHGHCIRSKNAKWANSISLLYLNSLSASWSVSSVRIIPNLGTDETIPQEIKSILIYRIRPIKAHFAYGNFSHHIKKPKGTVGIFN
jgi:hypothetical protein